MEFDAINDPQFLEILNLVYFMVYVFLIMAISIRIGVRYAMYSILGVKKPYLLRRDLVLWLTIGMVLALILYMRAVGVSPIDLRYNFLWVNGTSLLVITGLSYYAYVEWFKIEGPLPPEGPGDE